MIDITVEDSYLHRWTIVIRDSCYIKQGKKFGLSSEADARFSVWEMCVDIRPEELLLK